MTTYDKLSVKILPYERIVDWMSSRVGKELCTPLICFLKNKKLLKDS